MTDRFDDAKRALEGVPANDVWDEAERRAADGTVVPLAAASGGGGRHSGRWLAGAAAVAVLAVGTVAVLANDDDAPVDAGPGSEPPDGEEVQVYGDELVPGCVFGMRGEPVLEPHSLGSVESPTGDPELRGTLAEGALNDQQSYSIQSPGQVVTDLVGERVEDVELQRGTAQIWFQSDAAVQVRWFTGGQDACESFTVTVSGGTEDENRHAAVDLAERVVLEGELPADNPVHPTPGSNPLAHTEWQLESSAIDGEPTEGDGSVFSFTAGAVTWTDGCNGKGATYTYTAGVLTLSDVGTTDVYCEPNPTSDAINEVMTSGPVAVTFDGSLATLTDGVFELVLRPREATARPAFDTSSLIGTTWTITSVANAGQVVDLDGAVRAIEFMEREIAWPDACNSATTPITYGETYGDGTITVTGPSRSTLAGCEHDEGESLIRHVISPLPYDPDAAPISVERTGDQLVLERGDAVITLAPS